MLPNRVSFPPGERYGAAVTEERRDDWEAFHRIKAEVERDVAEKLAAAKADAADRGKEPFDLEKVLEMYTPYSQYRYPAPLDELRHHMERSYYLSSPAMMTLAEFADYLRSADMG